MTYTIHDAVAAVEARQEATAAEPTKEAPELNKSEQVQVDPDTEEDADVESGESPTIEPAVEEDEGSDEAGEQLPPIEAPEFWDAESKERFAKLSPEAQQLIAEQAKPASVAIATALNEAKKIQRAFEEKAAKVNETLTTLEEILPVAHQKFVSRYPSDFEEQMDAYLTHNPEDAAQVNRALVEYRKEKAELGRITNASRDALRQAQSVFVQQEEAKLIERAVTDPAARKLTDPQVGKTVRKEVFDYITGQGVPAEAVHRASSDELILAYKAMMFDRAQTAPTSTGERSAPKTSGMKPSTTSTPQPQAAKLNDLRKQAARSGSMDDVFALIEAKRAANNKKR